MMKKAIYKYSKFYLLLILICHLRKSCLHHIMMKNDIESIQNMVNIINKQLSSTDVIVEFDNNNYNIDCDGKNHFYIHNSLTFSSKNNTIFNFQDSRKGSFYIHFSAGLVDKKVVFQNITFFNYNYEYDNNSNLIIIDTEDTTNRYTVEFNNCTFNSIKGLISNIKIICLISTQSTPQILFNNCKF
eukprot:jgi/Orpsp1_1/1185309/evm.model.c7180000093178.1